MSNDKTNKTEKEKLFLDDSTISAIKNKIGNRIYFYVAIAFIFFNWQEILILIKSDDNIYYTLAIIFNGRVNFSIFGYYFTLSPWAFHFGIPVGLGVIASVLSPIFDYFLSFITVRWVAKKQILGDRASVVEFENLQELRIKGLNKLKKANDLENMNQKLTLENKSLLDSNKKLQSIRTDLFFGVKAFVDFHDEHGELKNNNDIIEFLKLVENTDFYKDQTIVGRINRVVSDLKKFKPSKEKNGNI